MIIIIVSFCNEYIRKLTNKHKTIRLSPQKRKLAQLNCLTFSVHARNMIFASLLKNSFFKWIATSPQNLICYIIFLNSIELLFHRLMIDLYKSDAYLQFWNLCKDMSFNLPWNSNSLIGWNMIPKINFRLEREKSSEPCWLVQYPKNRLYNCTHCTTQTPNL